MISPEEWTLLRVKLDELVDDPDWSATNVVPPPVICAAMASCANQGGRPFTGIEVFTQGIADADRAVQARSTMTTSMTLVEIVSRSVPARGGTLLDVPAVVDSAVVLSVPPQRVVYFPINGTARFTIRISAAANDAVDRLEIWWRSTSR